MKLSVILCLLGVERPSGAQVFKSAAARAANGASRVRGRRLGNCSDWSHGIVGYDVVLNNTLEQAAVNEPWPFAEFEHGSPYEGLFVDPIRHFAFCTIEKNACSEWSTILHKLWRNDSSEDRVAHGIPHLSSDYWGPSRQHMVFTNPAAIRAVFVREPLARFASAFLDKCSTMSCGNPYCFARAALGYGAGQALTMRDVVVWMLARDPATLDGHWKLQSEHCELRKRLREYNIVGYMQKNTLAQDSTCVMERAGIADYNFQGDGRPFWKTEVEGEEEVEGELRPTDDSARTDLTEAEVLKKLFTTESARLLIGHFRKDYELFRFEPEPAWVANATGEWYEVVPPDFCSSDKFMAKSPYVEMLGERHGSEARGGEDDVVRLAHHAGFTRLQPNRTAA